MSNFIKISIVAVSCIFLIVRVHGQSERVIEVTPSDKAKLPGILSIFDEAGKVASPERRSVLLKEFLDKGAELSNNTNSIELWVKRGTAALELNIPSSGKEAGERLLQLEDRNKFDATTQQLLTSFEKKGWVTRPKTSMAEERRSLQIELQLLALRYGTFRQYSPQKNGEVWDWNNRLNIEFKNDEVLITSEFTSPKYLVLDAGQKLADQSQTYKFVLGDLDSSKIHAIEEKYEWLDSSHFNVQGATKADQR